MRPEDVTQKVYPLMAKQFGVPLEEIRPESSLEKDFGADSVALIELMVSLEDAFDLEVPDVTNRNISTAGDVVNVICEVMALPAAQGGVSAGGKDVSAQLR
jgi:acyl carrier protein